MSTPARIDAVAPVPSRTVRLVAALTVLSWFGMIVHTGSRPLSRASWLRKSSSQRFCSSRSSPSVLPWPFLPFVPEQTLQHYVAHVLYAAYQVPLLVVLLRRRPARAT
jgi:hypothetical protein